MVNSYESCSSAISIFLLILAILEIIITIIPLVALGDALRFTGTHLAAVCGLIAGLVTLPASIRLKFNESSPDLEKLHGHTSFFKKLTLFVSLVLNVIAATLTVVGLLKTKNFCQEFGRIMRVYHCNTPVRILVNMIQLNLDCCGAMAYRDWLSINWRMYEVSNDDDVIEEDNADAVPYSCCNKASDMACGHYDLRTYGTSSIHRIGCAKYIRRLTKQYLWILFTLYLVNIALEVLLLVIYYSDDDQIITKRRKRKNQPRTMVTGYARIEESPWEGMSNCSKGSDLTSKDSNRFESPKDSEDSDSNMSDGTEDETPELTSSHKQVRIFSPLGESSKSIKVVHDPE
ncbi:uncharacterized protein LOC123318817 [Coccinella septempunctata]|uniref:uncharacterized protein LOC123318817 n=1 Tax=Coccinella septempunctata TaxID=41139 RepID=UPI001D08131D|nr:uncharacterized protein LOC123318817 [Coccinella septempunctata]